MALSRERRAGRRYPLKMHAAYRLLLREDGRILSQARGQTVDISHTGLRLDTLKPYPIGATAEIVIEWPNATDDRPPVQLRVVGWVVRSDEHGTAVKILRHSFKGRQGDFLTGNAIWPDLSKELLTESAEN